MSVARALPAAHDPSLQIELLHFNEWRLRPTVGTQDLRADVDRELRLRLVEDDFVSSCRREIEPLLEGMPDDADAFIQWFLELRETGPGQHDRLFPWLAEKATIEQLRWFLTQEVAGEAGFDDLVAMTQIKMPTQAKLELARNYWDEMGRGLEIAMHGPMLARLASSLELTVVNEEIVPEALALGNLLAAFALNRRYAYHSIGALGAVELTAPDRSQLVNAALKRLRVPGRDRQYFALHATVDIQHSIAWNREIIVPLVREDRRLARPIAEGALMRLRAGQRCFERYRRELGVPEPSA